MKKIHLLLVLFVSTCSVFATNLTVAVTTPTIAPTPCNSGTFTITVTNNTTGQINDPVLKLTILSSGSNPSESMGSTPDISPTNPSPGVYAFDLGVLNAGSSVTFHYTLNYLCGAMPSSPVMSGTTIVPATMTDIIGMYQPGGTTPYSSGLVSLSVSGGPGASATSGSNPNMGVKYNCDYPFLNTLSTTGSSINTAQSINANMGDNFVRRIVYNNTGTVSFNGNVSFTDAICSAITMSSVNIYVAPANWAPAIGTNGQISSTTYTSKVTLTPVAGVVTTTTPLTVTQGSIIVVEEVGSVTGCIPTSCASTFQLNYGCAGVSLCRSASVAYYYIGKGLKAPTLVFSRLAPAPNYTTTTQHAFWDASCMDGTTATDWYYVVKNTGMGIAQNVTITLDKGRFGSYTFIDASTLDMNASGQFGFIAPNTHAGTATVNALQTGDFNGHVPACYSPGTQVKNASVTLSTMAAGEMILLHFKTYRCCPTAADNFLYNSAMYLNQWKIFVTGQDECSNNVTGTQSDLLITSGGYNYQAYISTLSIGTNPNGISTNGDDFAADLSLLQSYFAPFTQLQGSAACNTPYNFQIQNIAFPFGNAVFAGGDDQLYAPSSATGQPYGSAPRGQFQVQFQLERGLSMTNLTAPATVNITKGTTLWIPRSMTLTTTGTSTTPSLWTATFDISDLSGTTYCKNSTTLAGQANSAAIATGTAFASFMTGSVFNFQMAPCCPANPSSTYTVSTLFRPQSSSGCSCWIPLAQQSGTIFVHCPGCVTPGMIVHAPTTKRTNLGYTDSNNDGIADGTTPTTINPGTYTPISSVKTNFVIVGDQINDVVTADFFDGADCSQLNTSGSPYTYSGCCSPAGFSLATWQNMTGANMRYVYFEKAFLPITEDVEIQSTATLTYTPVGGVASTITLHVGTDYNQNTTNNTVLFTFDINNLVGRGSPSVPSSISFHTGDVFSINANYTICNNPSQMVQVNMNDYMFATPDVMPALYGTSTYAGSFVDAPTIVSPPSPGSPPCNPVSVCAPYTSSGTYVKFMCEPNGNCIYHFPVIENNSVTWSDKVGTTQCLKSVTSRYRSYIYGPYPNLFPFEFRVPPPVNLTTGIPLYGSGNYHFDITLPTCYNIVTGTVSTQSLVRTAGTGVQVSSTTIPCNSCPAITQTGSVPNIDFSFPTFSYNAYLSGVSPTGIIAGDEQFEQDITMQLAPDCSSSCTQTASMDDNAMTVTAPSLDGYGCSSASAINLTLGDPNYASPHQATLNLPGITFGFANLNYTVTTTTFTANIAAYVYSGGVQISSNGPNLFYIYIPISSVSGFLTGAPTITFNSNTYTATTVGSYYLYSIPNFVTGTLYLNGTLSGCPSTFPTTYTIPMSWGANCSGVAPTSLPPSSGGCFPSGTSSLNLTLNNVGASLNTATSVYSNSTCTPTITTTVPLAITSGGAYVNSIIFSVPPGATYASPYTLTLNGSPVAGTSLSGPLAQPTGSNRSGFTSGYNDYTITISPAIFVPAGQTITLTFKVTPSCQSTDYPYASFSGTKYCGATLTASTGFTGTIAVTNCGSLGLTTSGASVCSGGSVVLTASGGSAYTWSANSTTAGIPGGSGGTNPITVTPTTSTSSVTVTYTVTDGTCSNRTGTISVAVNVLPAAYTVSGGGSYCVGGAGVDVSLSNSDVGINYKLYKGTTMVSTLSGTGSLLHFGSQSTAGTYTVVAINATTLCSNNMTGSVTVTINQLPTTTATGTTICLGLPGDISATGGVTYSWSPATGLAATSGSPVSANPAATTTYTVTAADANGCSATTTCTVVVDSNCCHEPPSLSSTYVNGNLFDILRAASGRISINSIDNDLSGNIYIAGTLQDILIFTDHEETGGTLISTTATQQNYFLAKYSYDGTFQWEKAIEDNTLHAYSDYNISYVRADKNYDYVMWVAGTHPFSSGSSGNQHISLYDGTGRLVRYSLEDFSVGDPVDLAIDAGDLYVAEEIYSGTQQELVLSKYQTSLFQCWDANGGNNTPCYPLYIGSATTNVQSPNTTPYQWFAARIKPVCNGTTSYLCAATPDYVGLFDVTTGNIAASYTGGSTAWGSYCKMDVDPTGTYIVLSNGSTVRLFSFNGTNTILLVSTISSVTDPRDVICTSTGFIVSDYYGFHTFDYTGAAATSPFESYVPTGTPTNSGFYDRTMCHYGTTELLVAGPTSNNDIYHNTTTYTASSSSYERSFIKKYDINSGAVYKTSDGTHTGIVNSPYVKSDMLNLYPNPASADVSVSYTIAQELNRARLIIYDVLGQVIQTIQLRDAIGIRQIDLSKYASGSYSIVLENNTRKVLAKLLVKE
ncbi:MAG: hypothetical protein JWO03_2047 [Bacteroidetes bacterium]|nr:hypothetical protein [Bacteroidota bacterium]